jgi:hygromycin-B 7''-O-kinase
MDNLIPSRMFSDRLYYSAHFMDLAMWEPCVLRVCAHHGIKYQHIRPGIPGTFPTFIVDIVPNGAEPNLPSVVVKFFGLLFDGSASFRIEREMGHWLIQHTLPIRSPAVLGEGQLDAEWSYLIFEYVPGGSIAQVRDRISNHDWLEVARCMGAYIHQLHSLSLARLPDLTPAIQPSWDEYADFLSHQRLTCCTNHQHWNDLPAHLLDQLEGYILPVQQLIDFSGPPHLIHADLTADHLLGRLVDDRWQNLAIIDWGDTRLGNILYELVALHLGLFQADKDLLRACLDVYGLSDFYQQDFPRQALCMALLHQFPLPAQVSQPHQDARTLHELAESLFGV